MNSPLFHHEQGCGRHIILLHGWGMDHSLFADLQARLTTEGFHSISYDLRGFGASSKSTTPYTYDLHAQDLHELIEERDWHDVILCGFSMGAAIAVRYLTRFQQHNRIERLVLLGAAAPVFTQRSDWPYGVTQRDVDGLMLSVKKNRDAAIEQFATLCFSPSIDIDPEKLTQMQSIAARADSDALLDGLQELRDVDLRSEINALTLPTTILHGAHDAVCPIQFADYLAQHIAHAKIVRLEGVGHHFLHDIPNELFYKKLFRALSLL